MLYSNNLWLLAVFGSLAQALPTVLDARQVSTIADGQPQAPTSAAVVYTISDGQPQASSVVAVSVISDGQPQAPKATPLPTVSIDVGEVIGTTTVLPSATVTVNKFLGIPFAVSPPERFAPPVPAKPFSKPVVAQAWSPSCPQQFNYPAASRNFTIATYAGSGYPGDSEDCLYLNVYAPATAEKGKPVMFWIYGGALTFGTAGQVVYDGSSFAANQDVIVVSANYRTNVFGFSNSPELPITSRNVGFLDQRLALDWVQRNIAAFGGDPKKVTIFGESSGASSVDRLVTTPPKPVPFRGAITESGQASVSPDPSDAGPVSWQTLVAALNCTTAASQLACVRAVSAVVIQNTIEQLALSFSPVTDNVTQIPLPVNRAQHQSVPYMTGSNGQEGRVFVIGQTNLTAFIETDFPESATLRALITEAYAIGTPGVTNAYDAIAEIYTDYIFKCPAALVANESALAGFPTWRYYYNASIPNINPTAALAALGLPTLNLEAFHSSEIALVFGTYPTAGATEQEVALSKYMQTAWANFAKDPSGKGPGWPRYGSAKGVNAVGLADLGADGSVGSVMIPEYDVDFRCPLYTAIYEAVTVPAF